MIPRVDTAARMSQCVLHGTTVYFMGQTARGTDVTEQMRGILEKLSAMRFARK